jgi:uncharacterized protein YndB with AHSA1/START domain
MASGLNAESTVTINAPAETVWEALTTPLIIKQWFFGVDTQTDWKVGSPIVHTGIWQGKPYTDKGKILKFDPPNVLAHSHWSSFSNVPDQPENYQNVTYTLKNHGDHTHLTIHEENIPGAEAQAMSQKSWNMVLGQLKDLLEK